MLKIFLTAGISLFILGCDNFPANHLVYLDSKNKICEIYSIDSDKLTYKFDHQINFEDCPVIIGAELPIAGKIQAWSRRMKTKIEECQE